MITKKAIERLKWKFRKDKITVSQYDREALDVIIEHYNKSVERNESVYKLFIKLFLVEFLNQTIIKGHDTINALKIMENYLMMPLSYYYDSFANEVNHTKFMNFMKEQKIIENISDDNAIEDAQQNINEKLMQADYQKAIDILLKGWNPENVKSFIKNNVHEIIIKYKDYD